MRVRFTDFGSQRHFHLRLVLRLSSGLQQIFFWPHFWLLLSHRWEQHMSRSWNFWSPLLMASLEETCISRTPGSRTWGKKSVLLLSLDQSPQLDSLLIHCDRGRLEFSIIPNFPNCRPDCSVMLILWTCWNPFYERRDDICGCVSFSTSFSKRSAHFFYESAKLQTLLWNCDKLKNDSEVPIPDFSNIQNHALVGACGRRE